MKVQSILVFAFFLSAASFVQAQRGALGGNQFEPPAPALVSLKADSDAAQAIGEMLAVTPELPRGPLELLQQYRNQMTLVSQALSTDLAVISQAVQSGQIKRDDAEYLIQQRYQLALMQYEVFSALHDSLEYEIVQQAATAATQKSCRPDAVIVVQGAPSLSCTAAKHPSD